MLTQMGLDTVEIVLRTEGTFNVNLPADECGKVVTVVDLYRLVLNKLELPYVQASVIEERTQGRDRSQATFRQGGSLESLDERFGYCRERTTRLICWAGQFYGNLPLLET